MRMMVCNTVDRNTLRIVEYIYLFYLGLPKRFLDNLNKTNDLYFQNCCPENIRNEMHSYVLKYGCPILENSRLTSINLNMEEQKQWLTIL